MLSIIIEEFEIAYQLASETIGCITNFISYLKQDIDRTFRK
jgi:hypothetical protein